MSSGDPPRQARCVLITGAGRGIGLGFVRHYLDCDAIVIGTSRAAGKTSELAELEAKYRNQLLVEQLEVTSEESIFQFATRLTKKKISIDVAINNAGIAQEESFGQWTKRNFTDHLETNTVGPALIAQAITPLMREGSTLVNVTSGMGSLELNVHPNGPLDAYAISKSALNLLTERLAVKLEPRGITVIALSPGWVQTRMGGSEAPTSIPEAVSQMAQTIESLSQAATGSFLEADGTKLPW